MEKQNHILEIKDQTNLKILGRGSPRDHLSQIIFKLWPVARGFSSFLYTYRKTGLDSHFSIHEII